MEIKSFNQIERSNVDELEEIKSESEYWSEEDEQTQRFEISCKKKWVAVDELISLIEEMGAKEQSLFQLYDYLKHKLKLSIGGKC